jgi:drug/metabolite transporter (DMT)-like permease
MSEPETSRETSLLKGPMLALVSALLFGVSTPLAKVLLGNIHPLMLASILYLGSGIGLFIYSRFRRELSETALTAGDWLWLAPAIFCGGILGPILLLVGLQLTSASAASLLLVLEGVFSALIAWIAFREHFHIRIGIGMAAITLGAAVLAWQGEFSLETAYGPVLIVLACLSWAADNNFTRKVALSNPVQIAMIKGLVAGSVNLALCLLVGVVSFEPILVAAGALIGFLSYGVGLVIFVYALRAIGSARTAAYYSVAPFIGALVAVVLLGEPVTWQLAIAALLMAFGVWLHLSEHHEHPHQHETLEHSHSHIHDMHHQHEHSAKDPAHEPHVHTHVHRPTRHTHPHFPDAHHTHEHT